MEVLRMDLVETTTEILRCTITTVTGTDQARGAASTALKTEDCTAAAMVEPMIPLAIIRILDLLCKGMTTMMICGDLP